MSYKFCLDRYIEFCTKRGCPFFEESCPFLETPDNCPYAYVIEEEEEDD